MNPIDLNPEASKMFLQLQTAIGELQARQDAILVGAGIAQGVQYNWKVIDGIVQIEESEPSKLKAVKSPEEGEWKHLN